MYSRIQKLLSTLLGLCEYYTSHCQRIIMLLHCTWHQLNQATVCESYCHCRQRHISSQAYWSQVQWAKGLGALSVYLILCVSCVMCSETIFFT